MSVFQRFINWVESIMNIAIFSRRTGRRGGSAFVTPTSITVQPSSPVVVVGRTTQLTAVNQLGQQVQTLIVWSSSDNSKATINSSTGVVTGVATGSVTFTASWNSGALTGTKTVTVAAQTLTTAVMTTAPTSVVTTHTVTFGATGYDQLGFAMTVQPTFAYTSGTPATATIVSGTGVATGVATGTTSITATSGAVTTPGVTLTDVAQTLASITISPSSPTVANGTGQTFTKAGTDTLGGSMTVGAGTWASSDATDFPITSGGVCTPNVDSGSSVIQFTETASGISGTTTITASGTAMIFPNVTSVSGAPGDTFDLTPILDGSGTDVTAQCVCVINDPSIATIDGPTITSMTPAIIKQSDSALTISFVGTNFRSGVTIEGLPAGVTADSAVTVADDTHCSVNLSATGSATLGDANIYLSDANHGDTATKVLTVNPAVASVPHSALFLSKTAATTAPTGAHSNTLPLANNNGTIAWQNLVAAHVTGGISPYVQTTHGTTTQSAIHGGWASMPLTGGTGAIPSGTYTMKLGFYAEGSSAYKVAPVVYIYRPSDSSIVARLIDAATGISSVATGSSATAGKVFTFSVASAIDCLPGDLLCFEWWSIGPTNDFLHAQYGGSAAITEGGNTSADAMSEIVFSSAINFQS